MKIYLYAPLGNPSHRTRIVKFIKCYRPIFNDIYFLGWARNTAEKMARLEGVHTKHILYGGGYGRKSRKYYALWMVVVFFSALRIPRGSVVHALGWETAFPFFIASLFKRHKVIFDDADRFSLIFRMPEVLKYLIGWLEQKTSRASLVHLIPSFSRYEWSGSNMLVVKNNPLSSDVEYALRKGKARGGKMVIYINGWVGHTRGAPVFLEVFNRLALERKDIIINFAGRVDSEEGVKLLKLSNVNNFGELVQSEALKLYALADLVITYYDPIVPINIKAESNKWGDCFFFKVPFVVNSEVQTAAKFVKGGCAWSVPYGDINALYDLIIKLADDRGLLQVASFNFEKLSDEYETFDAEVLNMLEKYVLKKNVS